MLSWILAIHVQMSRTFDKGGAQGMLLNNLVGATDEAGHAHALCHPLTPSQCADREQWLPRQARLLGLLSCGRGERVPEAKPTISRPATADHSLRTDRNQTAPSRAMRTPKPCSIRWVPRGACGEGAETLWCLQIAALVPDDVSSRPACPMLAKYISRTHTHTHAHTHTH